MITRSPDYMIGDMPSEELIQSVLAEHALSLPRLDKLDRYYRGDGDIIRRTRADGLPNNRVSHPFCRYIASVTTGYLIGNPAAYSSDSQPDALQLITDAYDRCAAPSVDLENARHAAIYGRGVEYVHVDDNAVPHVTSLDPRQAFVVYDDSYDMRPLFGVYYSRRKALNGQDNGVRVWIMGPGRIAQYDMPSLTGRTMEPVSVLPHYFGGVPLVEYWNDEGERGDFEWVIPLVDAYDKLESDRVNDKEQFVDKLLILTGCTMDVDDRGRPPWRQLREDKALSLPDSDASAEYLSGALTESDVEILRAALETDIHKLSMVPNLADREFASNASGVAMRYKLWGLEQLINIKQQWFIEGLRARLKLFAHFMAVKGHPALDTDGVKITLSRSLPANTLEIAQTVQTADAANAASLETRVRMLHREDGWTDDMIQSEVDRIAVERGIIVDDPTQMPGDAALGDFERMGAVDQA